MIMTFVGIFLLVVAAAPGSAQQRPVVPTGKHVSPLATPGARLESLNPDLRGFPEYTAGQAISTATNPSHDTLLILTSGFNRLNGQDGKPIAEASQEYVFVYDISGPVARKAQVLKVPNTFAGIVFAPDGRNFFVSGGLDDNVHRFTPGVDGKWTEAGDPIQLGHFSGLGLTTGKEPLATGGLAVTGDGERVIAANVYNDSISVIDWKRGRVVGELDLRPGKNDSTKAGVPGGEYPFWVVTKGNDSAYVSSIRDREIVHVAVREPLAVLSRVRLDGNPNKMILNRDQSRLFVAADNSDTVTVIDTRTDRIVERIPTTAPHSVLEPHSTGSGPNDLVLSPDERTLYVTNGGTNCVAVVRVGDRDRESQVTGLLPTGWYPTSVNLSRDGRILYVVNGKTAAGANPHFHVKLKKTDSLKPGPAVTVNSRNEYVFQLEKAGFLTIPIPEAAELKRLTQVVAENNGFDARSNAREEKIMMALHERIKHVIYIIKENRTYDQVLGDLGRGNGDPPLAEFGEPITPNFHRMARDFVDLDNFYDSGEVSGDGWPWSTSGRESDFGQKAVPVQYADRGTGYEYEGLNRNINVGLASLSERKAANPKTPDDPDLLPGTVNLAEPDGPKGTPHGKGYIWDAVLRAGLTFREYGCMSDTNLDSPRDPHPFQNKTIMSRPANPELYKYGDPYYRGFDPGYPDFYREAEWEREFDGYVANKNLPSFEIVQLPVDHMGDFDTAISGVNTPEAQQADNDYATGRLIEHVASSPYKDNTLIFIVEDDAQDGPDHVDAHRSTAYIIGPYVKHGAVISTHYTTVSMLRTIEDVLGAEHLNLNTTAAHPMADVFDLNQREWNFQAKPSAVLAHTQLPLTAEALAIAKSGAPVKIAHPSDYWAERTRSLDFSSEDHVRADLFNRIIWEGLKGTKYPATRATAASSESE
jgi:DNA-binding beta-propeller fold protein YncE